MNFKETVEMLGKYITCCTITILSSVIGFIIFAVYFINIGVAGKANLYTYLGPTDFFIIIGIGAVLLVMVFSVIITPSLMLTELKEDFHNWSSKSESFKKPTKLWSCAWLKVILKWFLSRPYILLLIFSIAIFILLGAFFATALINPSSEWWLIILILFIVGIFCLTVWIYNKDKNVWLRLAFVILLFLIILAPSKIIRLAGYGNNWACLTLTPSEGQSLKMNPEFRDLIICTNESCYTTKQVFIPLQLRDYIFITNKTDDNTKVETIEVISKKEAHIFHITPIPVSKKL